MKTNPELVKRMVDEGHIVGNHTMSHPSLPDRANDLNLFNSEFKDVENRYKKVTGKEMVKLFRPPMGQYSQKSLAMTKNLGYTSVFWSFAYHDWDPNEQPANNDAIKKIMNHLHDGSILLLHAVSKTNTEILGDFIDKAECEGYKFKLLDPK
nr:polysaccharide deacetylase family protein [[Clostridium] dakarense]